MNHVEIVRKLIGPIYPQGQASEDAERLENVHALIRLHGFITDDLIALAKKSNSPEASVKAIGDAAHDALTDHVTRTYEQLSLQEDIVEDALEHAKRVLDAMDPAEKAVIFRALEMNVERALDETRKRKEE